MSQLEIKSLQQQLADSEKRLSELELEHQQLQTVRRQAAGRWRAAAWKSVAARSASELRALADRWRLTKALLYGGPVVATGLALFVAHIGFDVIASLAVGAMYQLGFPSPMLKAGIPFGAIVVGLASAIATTVISLLLLRSILVLSDPRSLRQKADEARAMADRFHQAKFDAELAQAAVLSAISEMRIKIGGCRSSLQEASDRLYERQLAEREAWFLRAQELMREEWRVMNEADFGSFVARGLENLRYRVTRNSATQQPSVQLIATASHTRVAIGICGKKHPFTHADLDQLLAAKEELQCDDCYLVTNREFPAAVRKVVQSQGIGLVDRTNLRDFVLGKMLAYVADEPR